MVCHLLHLPAVPRPDDAADAAAIAICSTFTWQMRSSSFVVSLAFSREKDGFSLKSCPFGVFGAVLLFSDLVDVDGTNVWSSY
jgi:hypothetical protein